MMCSVVILPRGHLLATDRERLAMFTFIYFFKRLSHHNEMCPFPDALLRDIGLSKLLVTSHKSSWLTASGEPHLPAAGRLNSAPSIVKPSFGGALKREAASGV